MTWEELKDKISLMTEEEQQQEVAVWGENMNLMKDCSLEKTDEDFANLERRLLKHALANVILSIISVAAIIALFTLIQN